MAFHWKNGWMFERQENGDVKFWNDEKKVLVEHVPADEWASIIASVANQGETAGRYERAKEFHQKG